MEKAYNKTQWENTPSTNTPINETNLNNIENGIDEIDSRVVTLSNTKSNVDWVQMQTDGKKIAEVTIDGVKKNVYVPRGTGGSGGASSWEDLEEKPFETLDNNNFNVSDGILSIKDKASGVEVSAIKESLTQYEQDGFLGKNKYDGNVFEKAFIQTNGVPTQNDNFYNAVAKVEPNKTVTISFNKYSSVRGGVFGFANYPTLNAQGTVIVPFDTNAWTEKTITVPSGVNYIAFVAWKRDTETTLTLEQKIADIQVEYGSEKTPYTEYAISNTGLTQIVEDAIDNGYLPNNRFNEDDLLGGYFSTSGYNSTAIYSWAIMVVPIKSDKMALSGFPTDSGAYSAYLTPTKAFSKVAWGTESNNGVHDIDTSYQYIGICFRNNNASGFPNKMIAYGTDATYVPYAPSNLELKQSLSQLESVQSGSVTSTTNIASTVRMRLKKVGKVVSINFYFSLNAISDGLTNWYDLFQLPSGFFVNGTNVDFVMTDFDKNTFQAMISGTGMVRFVPRANIAQGRLALINLTYILD